MRGHVLPCENERKEKQMVMVGSRLPGCGTVRSADASLALPGPHTGHDFLPFETKFNVSRWRQSQRVQKNGTRVVASVKHEYDLDWTTDAGATVWFAMHRSLG